MRRDATVLCKQLACASEYVLRVKHLCDNLLNLKSSARVEIRRCSMPGLQLPPRAVPQRHLYHVRRHNLKPDTSVFHSLPAIFPLAAAATRAPWARCQGADTMTVLGSGQAALGQPFWHVVSPVSFVSPLQILQALAGLASWAANFPLVVASSQMSRGILSMHRQPNPGRTMRGAAGARKSC